jgi:hypothetical protein
MTEKPETTRKLNMSLDEVISEKKKTEKHDKFSRNNRRDGGNKFRRNDRDNRNRGDRRDFNRRNDRRDDRRGGNFRRNNDRVIEVHNI